jgi:hypothetical protein
VEDVVATTAVSPPSAALDPVYVVLPKLVVGVTLRRIILMMVLITAYIAIYSIIVSAPIFFLILLGVALLICLGFVFLITPLVRRSTLLEDPAPTPADIEHDSRHDEIRALLIDAMLRRSHWQNLREGSLWSWADMENLRIERGLPRLRTIATLPLQPELVSIRRDLELLEPELILSSRPQTTLASAALAGMFLFQAFFQVSQRHWVFGAVTIGLAALMIASIPDIRNRIPGLRFDDRAPIAGMGVIEDSRRRRWTVDDSTMYTWAKGVRQPLFVHFVGPAGWLSMTFASSEDSDFINLWQRWTHSNPRPDLL